MPQISAGIVLYRFRTGVLETLLIHPGGPFWAKKDEGAWSIPKGLCDPLEDPKAAAAREFAEETGQMLALPLVPLGRFRQPSGKILLVWAAEGDFDPHALRSNMFSMEWPPRSGRLQDFPEADRAGWFAPDEARRKILKGQIAVLDALDAALAAGNGAA